VIVLLVALLQGDGWTVSPAHPTVGDTIVIERTVDAPAGWRVRPGKLERSADVEQLGDPVVVVGTHGSRVRYQLVAWVAGAATVELPPLWRLGPDGSTDSIPGGTATISVVSVIPDSIRSPQPQPALGPLLLDRASPVAVIAAVVLSVGALLLLLAWRRRPPKTLPQDLALATDAAVPDNRWLAAGEPKAVAARAAQTLRRAVAHAIPDAHEALSTAECLEAVERAWPNAPLRDLRDLLEALDHVAFATAHGAAVDSLASRARALAREPSGNGTKVKAG
jgi:hypothetical protein